ncbi:MAG: radical SAM protein [Anaerolineae bacterium]|nr:radical SAM protein [Anaerolineae bacterium]
MKPVTSTPIDAPPALDFYPLAGSSLPIFRQDRAAASLFYAPGYVALADAPIAGDFARAVIANQSWRWPAVAALRQHAHTAEQTYRESLARPFAPVCLTLYLNNQCNLACRYCFAMGDPGPPAHLDVEAARQGAHLVAANCQAQQRPLVAVFHGGGEPALNQAHAERLLVMLDDVAAAYGLETFRYIATNGVMPEDRARWLAARFDLIGLSCDGPATIHDYQRPLANGADSLPFVERTARVIHEHGTPLDVRVTLTPGSVHRQADIARYLCTQLQPREIHVEWMYYVGRADQDRRGDIPAHSAQEIVAYFQEGRAAAAGYGVPWRMSISRPDHLHGPYCQVFRDVLHVVPGGAATACFKTTSGAQARTQGVVIGVPGDSQAMVLDHQRVDQLRQQLARIPARCQTCFNRWHCVRGCPEYCALDSDPGSEPPAARCEIAQTLTRMYLDETLADLRTTQSPVDGVLAGTVII